MYAGGRHACAEAKPYRPVAHAPEVGISPTSSSARATSGRAPSRAGTRNEERPAPPRGKGRREVRRWRWRRRWHLTLENVLSDIALPVIHVPVRVTDVVVPNHWVHTKIAGLHRWIPRTPMTWTGGVVLRAPGPRPPQRHRCGKGLGASWAQSRPGYRNAQRHQSPGDDPYANVSDFHGSPFGHAPLLGASRPLVHSGRRATDPNNGRRRQEVGIGRSRGLNPPPGLNQSPALNGETAGQ